MTGSGQGAGSESSDRGLSGAAREHHVDGVKKLSGPVAKHNFDAQGPKF